MESETKAILSLVCTPIGNLEDITYRAIRVLSEASVVACEDTRHTRKIFSKYEITAPKMISYHEHNEEKAGASILAMLEEGQSVVLCSDAGSPSISDPGYRIVDLVTRNGFNVEVIPGPNAPLTALLTSGLPTSDFTFKGFAPRKPGALSKFFEEDKESEHTLIIFESPYRIEKFLTAALEALGDRKAAVCLEMTKMFEQISRGYLSELLEKFRGVKVKGEITVVIAGNKPKFINTP